MRSEGDICICSITLCTIVKRTEEKIHPLSIRVHVHLLVRLIDRIQRAIDQELSGNKGISPEACDCDGLSSSFEEGRWPI